MQSLALALLFTVVAPLPGPLAAEWWGSVQQEIAASEYEVSWQSQPTLAGLPPAWHAPNRRQGFRAWRRRPRTTGARACSSSGSQPRP